MTFHSDEYYRHYILTHLQDVHLAANDALVTVLKNGDRRVYKNRLEKEYGTGKRATVELTTKFPTVLAKYREAKKQDVEPALTDAELAKATRSSKLNLDKLLRAVTRHSIPSSRG
jgi:hypothetical protein